MAMMRALAARGHRIFALEQPDDLSGSTGRRAREARPLELSDDDHHWYRAGEREDRALAGLRRGADAQGPAVRHGVPVRDVPARAGGARGRARVQPAARDPRLQREAGDRAVRRIHRADARHARRRVGSAASSTSTATSSSSRSTAWAARRSSACATTTRTATSSSRRSRSSGARTVMAQRYHARDRRGRQARAADRRRAGAVLRSRASRSRAKRAATSPRADAASRGR